MKNTKEKSLRSLVEKWLASAPATPVHVIAFGRTRRDGSRYVCVETAGGVRALFFFRHDDGDWCVFPPASDRRKSASGATTASTWRRYVAPAPNSFDASNSMQA
jgi:hypothetical protein